MPTGEHDHAVHEGDPHCRELEQVGQAAGSRAHPFFALGTSVVERCGAVICGLVLGAKNDYQAQEGDAD